MDATDISFFRQTTSGCTNRYSRSKAGIFYLPLDAGNKIVHHLSKLALACLVLT